MCSRAGLLIGWDYAAQRALVTRADCDSWSCPECSRRMSENWVLRAQIGVRQFLNAGRTVDFVTITSHEKLKTFEATEAVWRAAWPVLYAALKRKDRDLQFFLVPERHKSGRMHVHALWTAHVSKRWLKDNARARGLGHQADVDGVKSPHQATQYVTKYVGKSLGDDVPKRFRRVRVSQGWPEMPTPESETSGLKWEYLSGNGALQAVYMECAARHIDLIDMETGAYFDDVDLGTIAAPIGSLTYARTSI